jgi:hypothetical protein
MKFPSLFFLAFLFCFTSVAQSDFIILKRKEHTLKTFYIGSQISFTTSLRYYSGRINSIKKDSISLLEYDIRQLPTSMGVYILDTVATYHSEIYYKDILKFQKEKKGFDLAASGASLLGGGILLTGIGLGTWLFTKTGDQYHAGPKLVIGSAILGAVGYVLLKTNNNNYPIGKKYHLNYISTK